MKNGLDPNPAWISHTIGIEHRITVTEYQIERMDHRLGTLEADKKAVLVAWTKLTRGALSLLAALVLALALNGSTPLHALTHFLKSSG